MGNSRVDHIQNFIVCLLLVHFIDYSAWDVYDLNDDLVVEATEIDLMELLFAVEFSRRNTAVLIHFENHFFGVRSH